MRGVFDALGFTPAWDGDKRIATLIRDDYVIKLNIGSYNFTVNDAVFYLDVPPQIIGGRTLLPLRAILESVGYDNINWYASSRTVRIHNPESFVPVFIQEPLPQHIIRQITGITFHERTPFEYDFLAYLTVTHVNTYSS